MTCLKFKQRIKFLRRKVFVNDIWNKSYMNYRNEMKMKKWSFPFIFIFFISAVHIWFISYIINTHFFHGNIWIHNWPAPNVSGFIAQLVEHRTGIARSRVQTPLKSLIFFFFSGFFTQLHKLRSLRRSFLHFQKRFFMYVVACQKEFKS